MLETIIKSALAEYITIKNPVTFSFFLTKNGEDESRWQKKNLLKKNIAAKKIAKSIQVDKSYVNS